MAHWVNGRIYHFGGKSRALSIDKVCIIFFYIANHVIVIVFSINNVYVLVL